MSRADQAKDQRTTDVSIPAHEASLAKAALGSTARRLQRHAAQLLDPKAWARSHPWITLGVTALSGFAAGAVVARPPRFDAEHKEEWKVRVRKGRRVARTLWALVAPMLRVAGTVGRMAASRSSASHNGWSDDED